MCQYKRGDIVEVLAYNRWEPRIFITYIEGAVHPYVCVEYSNSQQFKKGAEFKTHNWQTIRPYNKLNDLKVDDKVLVSYDQINWRRRYFSGKSRNGMIQTFDSGRTSWSGIGSFESWDYWKLPQEGDK